MKFRQRLRTRGYPKTIIESSLQVLKQTLRVLAIQSQNEGHLFSRQDKTRQLYLARVAESAARLVSLGALGSIGLTYTPLQ